MMSTTIGSGFAEVFATAAAKTFTFLPPFSPPYGHYSFIARSQALQRYFLEGRCWEDAAPSVKDPDRVADPSTLRRWAHRRLLSVCCWVMAGAIGPHFLQAPTILAWDLIALCRILPIEARSP